MTKDFDFQLDEDYKANSMNLYKEQKVAKLGYSAAAILDWAEYEKILD